MMKTSLMGAAGLALLLAAGCSGGDTNQSKGTTGPVTIDDRALAKEGAGSDGRLDLEEYKRASRGIHTQLDSNTDGSLSKEEVDRLPENRRAGWMYGDTDRNGTVTAAEYEGIMITKFTARDMNYDRAVTVEEIPEGTPASGHLF